MTDAATALGPLTQLRAFLTEHIPLDLTPSVLLLTFIMASLIWLLRNGRGSKGADGQPRRASFWQFILPKDIYTHVSARVDIGLYIIARIGYVMWSGALLATLGPWAEQGVIGGLSAIFGASPMLGNGIGWMVLYSFTAFLLYDFIFFLTHLAFHKIPILWAIHKVRHSAEVLTPLTRYREHFIAGPVWAGGQALALGIAAGIFAYLCGGGITEATILNISAFLFIFGLTGSLRHYHVQLHYPRWLSYWLQSPAMHHVHHSYLPQHWDKNLSVVTSIWGRMFGTLYIPARDEYTPWGIGPKAQGEHRSLRDNLIGPFRDWAQMMRRRWAGLPSDLRPSVIIIASPA